MTRILRLVACSLMIVLGAPAGAQGLLERVRGATGRVAMETPDGSVDLVREWRGDVCRSWLRNTGDQSVRIGEVVLFDIEHDLPDETGMYGEGFQMLSQTGGTLGSPVDIGAYTDRGHYRIPESSGARAVYGMMTLSPPTRGHALLGFSSCRRFVGKFYVSPGRVQVVVDCEGLELRVGESWELEEVLAIEGSDRGDLLAKLAGAIAEHHPPTFRRPVPTGWCSWYCFGPSVTAKNIEDNLAAIAEKAPELRYIQIDDGYQPWMGDWLDTGEAFGGDVREVLRAIRERGFEPAIWLAPFVASPESRLFAEHPGWFVRGDDGGPLRSDKVTFGGWRLGPWYVLDGTHPEVQGYLETLFRTMREEWGCTYFKLDAIAWGAMLGGAVEGRYHDEHATRVEAYRRGMEAIRRGAGDAFILGCNHPLWPSLGLIDGSRSSLDIGRSWDSFRSIGRENMGRTWQNGTLWWNDPDCVLLTGDLPEAEFRLHATWIFASGGMVLSGDDLTTISEPHLAMLRKLLPPTGVGAAFIDASWDVGIVAAGEDRRFLAAFNWGDEPASRRAKTPGVWRARDFWTGEALGEIRGEIDLGVLEGRSARLVELVRTGR